MRRDGFIGCGLVCWRLVCWAGCADGLSCVVRGRFRPFFAQCGYDCLSLSGSENGDDYRCGLHRAGRTLAAAVVAGVGVVCRGRICALVVGCQAAAGGANGIGFAAVLDVLLLAFFLPSLYPQAKWLDGVGDVPVSAEFNPITYDNTLKLLAVAAGPVCHR